MSISIVEYPRCVYYAIENFALRSLNHKASVLALHTIASCAVLGIGWVMKVENHPNQIAANVYFWGGITGLVSDVIGLCALQVRCEEGPPTPSEPLVQDHEYHSLQMA